MSAPYILVLVTTKDFEEAETIANELLKQKLIACANIVNPVVSHFHWSGTISKSEECLVIMKSHAALFPKISECVKVLHSYEVPEILALPIVVGSDDYLAWIDESLK
jgi:periplasmic divalent cation tolerance protein